MASLSAPPMTAHVQELHSLLHGLNVLDEMLAGIEDTSLRKRLLMKLDNWRDKSIRMINQVYEEQVQEIHETVKKIDLAKAIEHEEQNVQGLVKDNAVACEQIQRMKQTLEDLKQKVDEIFISLSILNHWLLTVIQFLFVTLQMVVLLDEKR